MAIGGLLRALVTDPARLGARPQCCGCRPPRKPIATLGGSAKGAQGVAVDSSGKVYITTQFNEDSSNNAGGMITVLSPLGEGEVKTIATVYTTGKTDLRDVESIAPDSKANIYVAMPSGGSSDLGTVAVFAAGRYGNMPPTITISGDDSRLHFREGITVDPRGILYVANMGNGRTTGSVTVYSAGSKSHPLRHRVCLLRRSPGNSAKWPPFGAF